MTLPRRDLDFLLDDFRDRVPHVVHALAVSADGLLSAADSGLARDDADRLAAVCSGLLSLLRNASASFGAGELSHNLTEYADGFMFSMASNTGVCLLVLADRDCDLGTVSYEMTALVNRVGDTLAPATRSFGTLAIGGS
jgi:predicted regulator of Ras-like GTPase activity (Roadblock/LC7/MglB family)